MLGFRLKIIKIKNDYLILKLILIIINNNFMDQLAFSILNININETPKKDCPIVGYNLNELKVQVPINYDLPELKNILSPDAIELLKNLFTQNNIIYIQEYLNQDIYEFNQEYNVWDLYIIIQNSIDTYLVSIYHWKEYRKEPHIEPCKYQEFNFTRYCLLDDNDPNYYSDREKYIVDIVYNSENHYLINYYEQFMTEYNSKMDENA